MTETLFERYVVSGGWAMLVLIPASVVVFATMIRGLTVLFGKGAKQTADEIFATVQQARANSSGYARSDALATVQNRALREFSLIQPLQIIQGIAPLIGALGAVLGIRKVSGRLIQAGDTMRLAEGVERSLYPLIFGLTLGLISALVYYSLKARLYRLESDLWTEAGLAAYEEKSTRTARPIAGNS